MRELFLKEKPVRALVIIRQHRDEIYGSIVSQEIDTTYAHTVKIISKLEDRGLVKSERKGRKKILELTDEGERYADVFINLLNMFNGHEIDTESGETEERPDMSLDSLLSESES